MNTSAGCISYSLLTSINQVNKIIMITEIFHREQCNLGFSLICTCISLQLFMSYEIDVFMVEGLELANKGPNTRG